MAIPVDQGKLAKGMVEVIHIPAGKQAETKCIEGTLHNYQKLVGGYIETVRVPECSGEPRLLVVNEEGILKSLPFNSVASIIAQRMIVGDAFVIFEKDFN